MVRPLASDAQVPGTAGPGSGSQDNVIFRSSLSGPPAEAAPEGSQSSSIPLFPSFFDTRPGPDVFRHAAAALGLPQDALSGALLAFARFFSIPFNRETLSGLRREVLDAGASLPGAGRQRGKTEAEALAAAAGTDKGVRLSREALETFAGFLSEPWTPDSGGSFSGQGENDNSEERREPAWDRCPQPEELRNLFERCMNSSEQNGLLGLLNRIPGKNGQQWVVWPFKICVKGIDLSVLFRLLIRKPLYSTPYPAEGRLIADIAGPKRRWRFVLDKNSREQLKVDISVFPEMSPGGLKSLEQEAERVFKSLGKDVELRARNGDNELSFTDFLVHEVLPSVNEEV
ncbi:MAG: hypothetical protein LBC62_07590 [Treponema sp.]|nr:hypothetical protein [Treponema sp.]